MGWNIYDGVKTAKEAINRTIEEFAADVKVIDQKLVGQHNWLILEKNQQRVIVLMLLKKYKDGRGVKLIDETAYPYYYDCPVSLLKNAGVPVDETASKWRKAVVDYHEARKLARQKKADLAPGKQILIDGYLYTLTSYNGRRGWLAQRSDGLLYKISNYTLNRFAAILDPALMENKQD